MPTLNLTATAQMLNLATEHGVPAAALLDVLRVSTGQSWMGDNLDNVAYDLLLKDVGLLHGELGSLPTPDLDGDVEGEILEARKALGVPGAQVDGN